MRTEQDGLKRNIIWEYALIVLAMLAGYVIMPYLIGPILGDHKGIDGIGTALGLVILIRIGRSILAFLFMFLNPIRILVQYRKEIKAIRATGKKLGSICLICVPILLAALVIFEVPLENLKYDWKYRRAEGAYALSPDQYKPVDAFFEELSDRGLLFEEKDKSLLEMLNRKYDGITENNKKYYYTEADMMALSDYIFYDTFKNKQVLSKTSTEKAPWYMYNAILVLPEGESEFRYAPIARYDEQNSISGTFYPYFEDCYIECKILYVDGETYAIIGVSENYDLGKDYDVYEKPYYTILSEKDTVKTYVDGKYCPNGAIRNQGWLFEMVPNTAEKSWATNYKVRKVDKLNVETINAVAGEIQRDYLGGKECIGN